jgi:hypothetical protein
MVYNSIPEFLSAQTNGISDIGKVVSREIHRDNAEMDVSPDAQAPMSKPI